MPFTFSHPAIILPFTYLPRRWYSLTGLVIGSGIPDFEYFLRMRVKSIHSHTFPGLLYFDLPLGLLCCFLYHGVVRDALVNSLPTIFKGRLLPFTNFNWVDEVRRKWAVILISLVVGAASHILWDSFTHDNGYFVAGIPVLQNRLSFVRFDLPLFKLLQHFSSLVGAIVIIFGLQSLPPVSVDHQKSATKGYWLRVLSIIIAVLVLRFAIVASAFYVGNLVVSIIASALLALILVPLFWPRYRIGATYKLK